MQKQSIISGKFPAILLGFLVLLGLYLMSLYSYLLFHSLVELFSIVIACGVFMIAWNSRRFLDNNYLLFIGIAYLFVGGLDLVHTLGYTGIGIFEGYGTNLPAQLWIATRYLESLSLLIAFSFFSRRLRPNLVFLSYTAVISLVLVSIFYWNIFPDSFVEGVGLTPFKKISEYIISLILMASVVLLFRNRTQFDRGVLRLLAASIVITIGSELLFTFYISAYGLSNLIGHFLKIISFYLIYKAIIETGIRNPFDLLFRNLKQSEETLRKVNDELEVRVEGRTSELRITNEQLTEEISQRKQAEEKIKQTAEEWETTFDSITDLVSIHDKDFRLIRVNKAFADTFKMKAEELIGKPCYEIMHGINELLPNCPFRKTLETEKPSMVEYFEPQLGMHLEATTAPIFDEKGEFTACVHIVRDITERKRAEDEIHLLLTMTQAISEAQDFHTVLEVAVGKVCETTGWDFGEVWVPSHDGRVLECSPAWYSGTNSLEKFRQLSEKFTFPPNMGLPGRVWSSKQPKWLPDVSTEPEAIFLRTQIASESGLKAGFGVPIVANGQVLAVLVFFMFESHEEDNRLVELVSAVATQLGSVIQRKQAQYDLGERVKELECLYSIAMITERPEATLDGVCQEVTNVIPPGWQYPDITCARITVNGKEFVTPNYRESTWKQTSDILVDGQRIGAVEVFYLEEKPEYAEGPFLKEERNLIDGIARQFASFIQHKLAEELEEHLTAMLRAIRNVNQLIVKEKNLDQLLKRVCENFINTRGFDIAWIAVFDRSGKIIKAAEAILDNDSLSIVHHLKQDKLPNCGQRALGQSAVVTTKESSSRCTECSLVKSCRDKGALTVRLEHNGKVYGLLSATLPAKFLAEPQEHSMFKEVAGDIGFSLYSMELEKERKRAEDSLKESEQNLIKGQEIGNMGYWKLNPVTQDVECSDELFKIFERGHDELTLNAFVDVVHPEDREYDLEHIQRGIEKGVPWDIEHRLLLKNGNIKWIRAIGEPNLDENGKVIQIIGIVQDITERKKMEEQLLTNDRLASIGELVSGVAHELNNPLTGIIGFADLLAGRKDLPDDVKEDLKLINKEARRTSNIVKNLLTFARKQPKEKQPTDLNKAIEVVLELRAYEQKVSNIQVNTQFTSDLPEIIANASDLQQVFLNIIVNAEYAMLEAHGKGTINITTERDGDIIRTSFADDGLGISEENLGHVFDPFFTTKEVGKGTGLGLSICHGIITEHGGRIYAESELGKGTTFIIELPVATTDNEGPTSEKS